MEIGGYDLVFPTNHPDALEICTKIIVKHWPDACFQTDFNKYKHINEIPFASINELFVYINAEAQMKWDHDYDTIENSMLYLLGDPNRITIVLDNPHTVEIQSVLDEIKDNC